MFFGIKTAQGIEYGGTGFLIHYRENGVLIPYVVTNRHVAERLDIDFTIRANLLDGRAEDIPVDRLDWCFPADKSVDLAAAVYLLPMTVFDHGYFLIEGTIHPPNDVMCGDPVSIVGLFRLHKGSRKSIPIVHTGNIAALPDALEPIPIKDRASGQIAEIVGYLVEAQTLEGLSGSPVFIRRFITMPFIQTPDKYVPMAFWTIGFLGIYQGAWDGPAGDVLAKEKSVPSGLRVPIGMGIVVPAEQVEKLLRDPSSEKQRKAYVNSMVADTVARTDSGFPERAASTETGARSARQAEAQPGAASDANPEHREDFRALLSAAVQKPKSAD